MRAFEVTLTFTFQPHTGFKESDDEKLKASIAATHYTSEQLTRYRKSFDPNTFVEGLSIFEIVPYSAKWLDEKITFRIEVDDYDIDPEEEENDKPIDIDEIQTYFKYESLEEGKYQGFDNGWVVPTADKEFEYGYMDYRMNEICIVQV